MERMTGFHGYHRKHAKSTSALNIVLANNNSNDNNNNVVSGGSSSTSTPTTGEQRACVVREQDQYMPIANVIRIMRRILPSHAKISDDAKETIQECVSEYISFITGEANDRCQREQRKTVTAEDVLWAMAKLGFDDYVEPLTVFLTRYRESETDRTTLLRPEPPFVKRITTSAANSSTSMIDPHSHSHHVGVGPYGPGFHLGPYPPGVFDAMGGYFRDGSGGGGSSSSTSHNGGLGSYGPFAQFK